MLRPIHCYSLTLFLLFPSFLQDGSQDSAASPLARRVAHAWGGALRRCGQCVAASSTQIAAAWRSPDSEDAARALAISALAVLRRGAESDALALAYAAAAHRDDYANRAAAESAGSSSGSGNTEGDASRMVALVAAHSALLDAATSAGWVCPEGVDEEGALAAKTRGGDAFKRGDLAGALECFSSAIAIAPLTAVARASRANRAACLLKLSRWSEAEADCSAILAQLAFKSGGHAIVADSGDAKARRKALFRRASARAQLDLRREAVADLVLLLNEEPANAAALALKSSLER